MVWWGFGAYFYLQVVNAFKVGKIRASRGGKWLDRATHPVAYRFHLIYYSILSAIMLLGPSIICIIGLLKL